VHNGDPQKLGLLAKLVLALLVLMPIAGIIWHGETLASFQRLWHDLVERPGGPMTFRFFLQPTMALIAAVADGIKDARTGRSPYFLTVLNQPQERMARMREGLNATARIILLGVAMDVMYQEQVFNAFYPAEAVLIALALAFVPYLLLRGPAARLARRLGVRNTGSTAAPHAASGKERT
jgi:hypothetical protein